MKKKIRWIIAHPLREDDSDKELMKILNDCKQKDTEVEVISLEEGKKGPHHLEYHFYEDIVLPPMLENIKEADEEGYDASVIGCFYELGLETSREISEDMIVIGPAESSMNIATTYGHKFSIIVGRKKWIPQMKNNVIKYGYKDRLASFRSVGLGVLDFHEDEEKTRKMITEEAKKAVEEDNAEVIILGCTRQFGFYKKLQKELGVPVIDTVIAPFKYAEFLTELNNRFEWKQSKVGGYETPPKEEMGKWDLEEQYL
ncbi:MAG: hydantoin racemase [Candidatus Thermoplasmatota archaeon]|nr:hydantoin racemase [Candidatus Thermoplasmatota archaeon]